MAEYGYCRISTPKQSIERQIRNIRGSYPKAVIYQEVFTGTKTDGRKKWEQLCRIVKEGDTIIFDSVSRMSRNADEGFQTYKDLYRRGIELVFIKEPFINTNTYAEAMNKRISLDVDTGDAAANDLVQTIADAINQYMFTLAERQIKLAFDQAEKEVSDLHQRTKEGIQTARLKGKQIGQREGVKLTTKKSIAAKTDILKYSKDFGGTLNDIECMKLIGISKNSYYKYKSELRNGQE